MARKRKIGVPVPEGNVVETYKIGNTTIKICDDAYRDKTPEDIKKIFDRIATEFGRKYAFANSEEA